MSDQIKILLVEDSEEIRDLLRFVFEARGFEIDSAQDGVDASSKELEQFDVIILDLQMPNMDGKQFLHLLRKERGLSIPVIMFTSHEQGGLEAELLESGANKLIAKPARADVLIKEVLSIMQSS